MQTPRVNCCEFWFHNSRDDLNLMRAVTALSLTASDGYALFADPNPLPTPDHLHNWYDFWTRQLGKAAGAGALQPDGTRRRTFERGVAVFNLMSNAMATVNLPTPMRSLATGLVTNRHTLPGTDGDIYLARPAPAVIGNLFWNPAQGFQMSFMADSNLTHRVWTSTNLLDWNVIGSGLQMLPGQFEFTDPGATQASQRFYRTSSP